MDYQRFIESKRSLLIAPAGYGKTYSIAECLKYTKGRQLILTHTHAGVTSLKNKLASHNYESHISYSVETISSFAQKYVSAFYPQHKIPNQNLSSEYHKFMVEHATTLFGISPVKNIIKTSYTGLFIDEYQDCTVPQHNMLMELTKFLPTHILGDHLQAIFRFDNSDELVNFDSDLQHFEKFHGLQTPHRWLQEGNNNELGEELKSIRSMLEVGKPIKLKSNDSIELHVLHVKKGDFQNSASSYRKWLKQLIENHDSQSLLILVPEYKEKNNGKLIPKGTVNDRAKIKSQIDFGHRLTLLEAIDDRSFYSLAKSADELINTIGNAKKPLKKCNQFLSKLFNTTDLKKWINTETNALVQKGNLVDKTKSDLFRECLNRFLDNPSYLSLRNVVICAKEDLKCKYKRNELLYSFLRAIEQAEINNLDTYQSMIEQRNRVRRSGTRENKRCIGTTLLTKGLEFDTVAILDAHNFNCPKNFYVAITRACKKLVIFSEKETLSFR